MKGALADGVLPGLLRSLYVGRKNGKLRIENSEGCRTVRFQHGQIIGASSNLTDERLGETLVRTGHLPAADLERATEVVLRDRKRLGVVLREMGICDEDKLQDNISIHVHEILKKVFGTQSGTFEFVEMPEAIGDEDTTLKVSTGELILEAVDRVTDPAVVRRSLGDLGRRLALPSDPLLRFQKVTLTPTDGFLLSRVDGTSTAREVIAMLPLPEDEVCRSLLGLLSTGLVEFTTPPPKREAPPRPAEPASVAPPVSATPAAAATPSPAAAAPPPAPPRENIEDRRKEIVDAWTGLKTRNHYEILGLPTDAIQSEVKEAYFRLARRFHPDAQTNPALADMRDKLEAVFIRLGQAYENLKARAPASRPVAPAPAPAPAPAAPPAEAPPPAAEPMLDSRTVAEIVARATKKMQEEKFWDAIQILEGVMNRSEGKALARVRTLLAQCYLKNPNWVRRAEEQLQLVLAKDPNSVDALYVLATIYKNGGLKNRAISHLRKVLELKPDHETAHADLVELAPTPEDQPGEGGGIFKRFFGKS
jgi:hypothetical protein